VGQLTLVLAATLCVALLRRFQPVLPRPIVIDVAAAYLAVTGRLDHSH
jgi:hypothetical protein